MAPLLSKSSWELDVVPGLLCCVAFVWKKVPFSERAVQWSLQRKAFWRLRVLLVLFWVSQEPRILFCPEAARVS